MADYTAVKEEFLQKGIAVVPGFASVDECKQMMDRMAALLEAWDPEESVGSVFGSNTDTHISNQYFLDSAEKISFFLEPECVDKETGRLRGDRPKHLCVHKVGHALHWLDPVFREYSTSEKVLNLVKALGYKDPVLPQSMYIFKQPEIGDQTTSHQDSCFLHTTPRLTCLGLWLALEDATEHNGCLWARPGSHKEGLRRVFVRNPEYFTEPRKSDKAVMFRDLEGAVANPYEGIIPDDLAKAGYEALPVKAGDLVLIHGEVDHLSLKNTTPKSRHTYQLHLVEGPKEGITWSPENWLQYKEGKPFPSVGQGRN